MQHHPYTPGQLIEIEVDGNWLTGRIRSCWHDTVGQRGRRTNNAKTEPVFEQVAYVSAVLTEGNKKAFNKIRVNRIRQSNHHENLVTSPKTAP